MTTRAFVNYLRQRARELRTANGANVTLTFALATIPLIGFVGAAVDYSHANSVKAAMQAAVDATGLMLSKEVGNLSISQIQTKADAYFKALFSRPEALDAHVSIEYASGSSQVLVSGSALVKTNFMGIMGFEYLPVGARSLAKWGNTRLRVALVLDTTGSMSSAGKMTALQTATKNLLDMLKGAATNPGDVYVSIIPFSKDVNVDNSNYTATSWIDWTDWDGPPPYMTTWLANSTNRATWAQVPGTQTAHSPTQVTDSVVRSIRPTASSTASNDPVERNLCGLHLPDHRQRQQDRQAVQLLLQRLLQQRHDRDRVERQLRSNAGLLLRRQRQQQGLPARTPGSRTRASPGTAASSTVAIPHGPNINNYDTNVTAPTIAHTRRRCLRPSSIPPARRR